MESSFMFDPSCEQHSPVRPLLKSSKRAKYPIIGEIKDVEGRWWWIRDVRETKYGFDLLCGSLVSRSIPHPVGYPGVIPTQELIDFWEANKRKRDCTVYNLPAGDTTLMYVRRRYGFDVHSATDIFYRERIDDLRTLSPSQFAAKHNVNACTVYSMRQRYLGRTSRETGWWRERRILNILLSRLTYREKARKLGIGATHARRLSLLAAAEQLPIAS
jgi:hypothetical protein